MLKGLRFQLRRGKLVRIIVSKSGVSLSAGPRGVSANFPVVNFPFVKRKRSPMLTVGLPGTGLSYRVPIKRVAKARLAPVSGRPVPGKAMPTEPISHGSTSSKPSHPGKAMPTAPREPVTVGEPPVSPNLNRAMWITIALIVMFMLLMMSLARA